MNKRFNDSTVQPISPSTHQPSLWFVGFFLLVIYTVPVVQAVVEFKKNHSIQALDILADAFVTPVRRAELLHELALKQSLFCDSLAKVLGPARDSSSESIAGPLIDEALATYAEMKKNLCAVNRHVNIDSTGRGVKALDSVAALFSGIQGHTAEKSTLAALRALTTRIRDEYPKPSLFNAPRSTLSAFTYIFWNDRYLRPYEKELENNSVFASSIRPRVRYFRYSVFGDIGDKGIVGRNGWFFYKPDVEFLIKPWVLDPRSVMVDPNDRPITDDPVKAIKKFQEQLAQRNIALMVVIVPGKPSIYPDLVSSLYRPGDAGKFTHSLRMIDELCKQGVDAIDLFAPFSRLRAFDAQAGDSLYLQKDTHWKARGVRTAAHEVAQHIKRFSWYSPGAVEYAMDSVVIDRIGDVGVMAGLPSSKARDSSNVFAPEKTKCYRVVRILRDVKGKEIERIPYKDDFRSSKILIIGDSFSRIYQTDEPRNAGWISHIAFELSQPVASLVNDGGASTLVRQSLARRAGILKGKKLVVWEIVERDFRFGEEGWKDVPLPASQTSAGSVKE
jgi:hypothetical protein